MKQQYQTPCVTVLRLQTEEIIMTSVEEMFDINVSFEALWKDI